ncbi:hypothetical protein R8Z50_23185 [Longispora sp. K20-0274]|uniref:hypothetical protein n=1 Tax=Longispora sp. K20-0274 TaxID=3088255 RepID=UPI00399A4046
MPHHLHFPREGRIPTAQQRTLSPAPSTYRGVALVAVAGVLDEQGAAALRRDVEAQHVRRGGPVVVSLERATGWTRSGLVGLERLAHSDPAGKVAFAAPPSMMIAALPGLIGYPTFPSVESAAAVLTAPPGPLPHLPAGAVHPTRYAHRPFPSEPASVFTARHWARTLLIDWGCRPHVPAVLSALSELAATSIAASTNTTDTFQVAAHTWRDHDRVRHLTVSLIDAHPHLGPHGDQVDAAAFRRGLRHIASLTDRLGSYRRHEPQACRIIWFSSQLA